MRGSGSTGAIVLSSLGLLAVGSAVIVLSQNRAALVLAVVMSRPIEATAATRHLGLAHYVAGWLALGAAIAFGLAAGRVRRAGSSFEGFKIATAGGAALFAVLGAVSLSYGAFLVEGAAAVLNPDREDMSRLTEVSSRILALRAGLSTVIAATIWLVSGRRWTRLEHRKARGLGLAVGAGIVLLVGGSALVATGPYRTAQSLPVPRLASPFERQRRARLTELPMVEHCTPLAALRPREIPVNPRKMRWCMWLNVEPPTLVEGGELDSLARGIVQMNHNMSVLGAPPADCVVLEVTRDLPSLGRALATAAGHFDRYYLLAARRRVVTTPTLGSVTVLEDCAVQFDVALDSGLTPSETTGLVDLAQRAERGGLLLRAQP